MAASPKLECGDWDGVDLVLCVRVYPRSRRTHADGVAGGRLRLRLTAPPVDGKANQKARELLAQAFGVRKSGVALEAGTTGRDKRFRIASPRRFPPGVLAAGKSAC